MSLGAPPILAAQYDVYEVCVSQETRHQMLNDLKALCDAPTKVPGLVSFYGAYHVPESGQISIVLEYVDGGSLADVQAKVRAAGRRGPLARAGWQGGANWSQRAGYPPAGAAHGWRAQPAERV